MKTKTRIITFHTVSGDGVRLDSADCKHCKLQSAAHECTIADTDYGYT